MRPGNYMKTLKISMVHDAGGRCWPGGFASPGKRGPRLLNFADFLMGLVLCIVPQFVVGAWRKDEEGASVTCHKPEDSGRASTN